MADTWIKSAPATSVANPSATTSDHKYPAERHADFSDIYRVNPEIIRFFNVPSDEVAQLKELQDWAMEDGKGVGDALSKIRKLELKLGAPKIGESRVGKMTNYIRIAKNLTSGSEKLKAEITSINNSLKTQLDKITVPHKEKIAKIKAELAEAEAAYRNAVKKYKVHANDQAKNIRDTYSREITDLRQMLKAYQE